MGNLCAQKDKTDINYEHINKQLTPGKHVPSQAMDLASKSPTKWNVAQDEDTAKTAADDTTEEVKVPAFSIDDH